MRRVTKPKRRTPASSGGERSKPHYVPVEMLSITTPRIDSQEIRQSLGMDRKDFAHRFGLSLRTIQNWEEGRRQPEGPAYAYLIAIKYAPEAVAHAHATFQQSSVLQWSATGSEVVHKQGVPTPVLHPMKR